MEWKYTIHIWVCGRVVNVIAGLHVDTDLSDGYISEFFGRLGRHDEITCCVRVRVAYVVVNECLLTHQV